MNSSLREEIIQVLLATQGQSEGVTADALIAALEAEQEPVDVQKAKAIESFVGTMIGAFESGFTQSNVLTLQQLHRIMQHHCKDEFNIDMPSITEVWGEEIAIACAAPTEETPEQSPAEFECDAINRFVSSEFPQRFVDYDGDAIAEKAKKYIARLRQQTKGESKPVINQERGE